MKRLWISLALLGLLSALSTVHIHALGRVTDALSQQLSQAQEQVRSQQWDQARATTQSAYDRWEDCALYLHATLPHEDIDSIHSGYLEALSYLSAQEDPSECCAVLARIINEMHLLLDEELPTLHNIF